MSNRLDPIAHIGIVLFGGLAGFLGGAMAAATFVIPAGCLVPMEAMIDPFIGALLGVWYAYALVESSFQSFRLPYELHAFVDTVFGCVLGYHLAAGILTAIEHHFANLALASSFILISACVVLVGSVFFWSTSRWIKRMEHDDPRIFINGKPYDRHLHSPGSPGPD
jgi:hypothetical protein